MTAYTAGPWSAQCWRDSTDRPESYIVGPLGEVPVAVLNTGPLWNEGQQRWDECQIANARLIAAAPEMLEALEQCQEYLRHSLGSTSDVNPFPAIDAAIAKARGQS